MCPENEDDILQASNPFIFFVVELVVVATHIKENSVRERYHTFVRPTENPELSDYCVTKTGITQVCETI